MMYSYAIQTDTMRRRVETIEAPTRPPQERGLIVPTWALKGVHSGRITQLRFPVFPVPEFDPRHGYGEMLIDNYWTNRKFCGLLEPKRRDMWMECPFGFIGDRLWVREATVVNTQDRGLLHGFVADGAETIGWDERVMAANHMRRVHCRTVLELTAKPRVEHQQYILTKDCIAEGIGNGSSPRRKYRERYERIHGEGCWDQSGYVWALTFKVVR